MNILNIFPKNTIPIPRKYTEGNYQNVSYIQAITFDAPKAHQENLGTTFGIITEQNEAFLNYFRVDV